MALKTIDRFDGEYFFLSNFAQSKISLMCVGIYMPFDKAYGEYTYDTVEHYYQTNKAETSSRRDAIRLAVTPHQAKNLGNHKTDTLLRRDWEAKKLLVMKTALGAKFASGSELGAHLLDTGDAWLIEGNNWGDTFWGVDHINGGQNWLGWLLMAQRAFLRSRGL